MNWRNKILKMRALINRKGRKNCKSKFAGDKFHFLPTFTSFFWKLENPKIHWRPQNGSKPSPIDTGESKIGYNPNIIFLGHFAGILYFSPHFLYFWKFSKNRKMNTSNWNFSWWCFSGFSINFSSSGSKILAPVEIFALWDDGKSLKKHQNRSLKPNHLTTLELLFTWKLERCRRGFINLRVHKLTVQTADSIIFAMTYHLKRPPGK